MPERILSGKSCFPAGTIPSLETDIAFEVRFNSSDDVEDNIVVYINGELAFGDDSDW